MADDRIVIEIELEDGKIIKGFQRVEKQSKETGRNVDRGLSRGFNRFQNGFAKGISGITGRLAILGSAFLAAFAGRRIIEAASKQQDAINQLNQSLASAGTFSKQASQKLQDFASGLQKVTTVGDETTIELIALARNFSNTNEQARELVSAAVDLSAATGLSLDGSVKNLGKTFAGLTGELGESVPALRNLTAEQLKAGAGVALIQERFAGFAASLRNTFSGAVDAARNSFGDLLETIGNLVVRSPAVVKFLDLISKSFDSLSNAVPDNKDLFGDFIRSALQFASVTNDLLIRPLEIFFNFFKAGFNGITLVVQGFLVVWLNIASKIVDGINTVTGKFSGLKTTLDLLKETAGEEFQAQLAITSESLKNLLNQETADNLSNRIAVLKEEFSSIPDTLSAAADQSNKIVESVAKNIQITISGINQTFASGISGGIQSFVGALAGGENAAAAFGKSVLSSLGDFAIKTGELIIAEAIGINALKTTLLTFGGFGAALAAGAGLIAVGAALKSFAGGPASTAGAAPASSSVGDSLSAVGSEVDEQADGLEDLQGQPASIVLNVQGDVLDTRETGLRLAEILQESFDGQALVT